MLYHRVFWVETLCLRRLTWYWEKKAVQMHEIDVEDSSDQAYMVYAIILSTVTVMSLDILKILPHCPVVEFVDILFKKFVSD